MVTLSLEKAYSQCTPGRVTQIFADLSPVLKTKEKNWKRERIFAKALGIAEKRGLGINFLKGSLAAVETRDFSVVLQP